MQTSRWSLILFQKGAEPYRLCPIYSGNNKQNIYVPFKAFKFKILILQTFGEEISMLDLWSSNSDIKSTHY